MSFGIFQGDVIIRTAIMAAIGDMKKNPWVLDYVFTSLAEDDTTKDDKHYGQKEIDKAKKWFLETDIPVMSAHRINDIRFPCVTIALSSSTEDRNSLGDVHYDVSEDTDGKEWPIIAGPFTPTGYSPATGEMTIPFDVASETTISNAMVLVDANGAQHEILEVTDVNVFTITEGTVANFKNATIRSPKPAYKVELESAKFKESYVIGCHVNGEPYELLYLHSVIVFALLRYRQEMFEARGFDVSTFNSTDLEQNTAIEGEGPFFSRFVNLNGTVHQTWPKYKQQKILATTLEPEISDVDGGTISLSDRDQQEADFLGV